MYMDTTYIHKSMYIHAVQNAALVHSFSDADR